MNSAAEDLMNDPVLSPAVSSRAAMRAMDAERGQAMSSLLHRKRDNVCTEVYEMVSEQPWHKHAAYYLATRTPRKKVAELFNVSTRTISALLTQPWFQKILSDVIKDTVGTDVMDLFKAELINSVNTLVEIRDSEKTPAIVRANVAKEIVDRVMGRTVQKVETTVTKGLSPDPVAEAKDLEQRLNLAKENLARQTLTPSKN